MKSLHWAIAALLIVTIALLLSYDSLMNKQLVLSADSGHELYAGSDRDTYNGKSRHHLSRDGRHLELNCSLDNSVYQYPYCQMSFQFGTSISGVDLTSYDDIVIKAAVAGPNSKLRVYLIAAVESDAVESGEANRKYHEVEFTPAEFGNEARIPLNLFKTSAWWLDTYGKDLFDSKIELNNVVTIQVSTGSDAPAGDYQILVDELVFEGKLLQRSNLYLLIILMWGLASVLLIIAYSHITKKKLSASLEKTTQLQQINEALQLQSKTYQQASQRDPLTGLYNRSALRDRAQNWVNRVVDHGDRLSLVLFDIDHFKAINDKHGHDVGDQVLIQLARYCDEHIRHQDLLVRWGGEEFAIFCPQTELQYAEMMANKIRNSMRSVDWPEDLKVTASFGVSEYYAGEPFTEFVNRADQALYFSKQHGRDMVSVTGLD
ncbi:GGDEF domain-containing protein [Neiella sp. HB171785]|uniref:diguanylate cyclase n=1 Tax=Neiella litorisoli TaxID=2771431 RepID=A0A8J6QRQ1_9GAMM|nr:GGDEF domain-containing protein [Neiella litorisoli]MBD1390396.1 GGDEF domain-containing protein [Neiella litorisoli]